MKTVLAEDGRTVLFETTLGDIEYKFTFENNDTAKLFVAAVSRASSDAETMIARKVRNGKCPRSLHIFFNRRCEKSPHPLSFFSLK